MVSLQSAGPQDAAQTLLSLGIPAHRVGFRYLYLAFSVFTKDNPPYFTKELYPSIAKLAGVPDWRAVEYGIRQAIQAAWKHRDNAIWNRYFPGLKQAPSNKYFIATLAEYL